MSEMPRAENFKQATQITEETPVAPAPSSSRGKLRRIALVLALLAGTAIGGYYGHGYWTTGRYLESTDDAYVKADSRLCCREGWEGGISLHSVRCRAPSRRGFRFGRRC